MKTIETTLIPLTPEAFKPPINYTLLQHLEDLPQLSNFFEQFTEFCFDIETTIEPNFLDRRIRTIQVGTRERQLIIDVTRIDKHDIIGILKPVLESNKWLKIGHNIEYDFKYMKLYFGINGWNVYDTYLAEKVLLCGKVHYTTKNFWGLDNLVGRYINLIMDKSLQKSFNLTDDLTEDQLFYCACDVRLPLAIKNMQLKEIEKKKLSKIVKIENDCVPAIVDIGINGFKIIPDKWNVEVEKVKESKKEVIKKMDTLFIPVVGKRGISEEERDRLIKLESDWKNCIFNKLDRKERREAFQDYARKLWKQEKLEKECEGDALINYESNIQLKNALLRMGHKKSELPDTSDQTLKKLEEYPEISLLREFRGLNKLITTYAPYVDMINTKTTRIHQDLNQLGAESGRMSSTHPNCQNIPKESNWRECFEAEDGNVFVIADFSAQEIRIMAEYSQEQSWINAIKRGEDLHSVVAEIVFGQQWKDLATPECEYYKTKQKCRCIGHSQDFVDGGKSLRERTKTISFGICYGMQEKKLAADLKITRTAARELLHKYYSAFKDLISWLDKAGKTTLNTLESKTLLGRIRHFRKVTWELAQEKAAEDRFGKRNAKASMDSIESNVIKQKMALMFAAIEREGKNSYIQGSGSDMLKLAIGAGCDSSGKPFLWHFLNDKAKLVNVVHDEIVVECREDVAKELEIIVKDCMIRAAGEMVKSIPFDVDTFVNKVWSKH